VRNKLHHPAISPEQDASKIVKNISTDGEVMSKIKVACFFLVQGVFIADPRLSSLHLTSATSRRTITLQSEADVHEYRGTGR